MDTAMTLLLNPASFKEPNQFAKVSRKNLGNQKRTTAICTSRIFAATAPAFTGGGAVSKACTGGGWSGWRMGMRSTLSYQRKAARVALKQRKGKKVVDKFAHRDELMQCGCR